MSASLEHQPAYPNRRTLLKGLLHGSAVLGAAPALLYDARRFEPLLSYPSSNIGHWAQPTCALPT